MNKDTLPRAKSNNHLEFCVEKGNYQLLFTVSAGYYAGVH